MRTGRDHLRYGGPWFTAASALPVSGELDWPAVARLVGAVATRPWHVMALLGLLVGVPRIDVQFSDSPAGQMLSEHFATSLRGLIPLNRLCQGVLILPESHDDYLRGRQRRALRNNLRRAAAAGIRCEVVACGSSTLQAMRQVVSHRRAPVTAEDRVGLMAVWPAVFSHPAVTALVARDRAGSAVAVSAAVIDAEITVIVLAVACSHEARWAIHDYLVRSLIATHVTYLIAADGRPFGALGLPPDVQYFQRLLGYEVCHVRPRTVCGPREPRSHGCDGCTLPPRSLYQQLATWDSDGDEAHRSNEVAQRFVSG
jgi:hypothetical protein